MNEDKKIFSCLRSLIECHSSQQTANFLNTTLSLLFPFMTSVITSGIGRLGIKRFFNYRKNISDVQFHSSDILHPLPYGASTVRRLLSNQELRMESHHQGTQVWYRTSYYFVFVCASHNLFCYPYLLKSTRNIGTISLF